MSPSPNYLRDNPLLPGPQYREMADTVIRSSAFVHDFLLRSESCGLPCEDRREAVNAQVEFATKFIKHFYPEP